MKTHEPTDDWCGCCGVAGQASRCPNCDYSICPKCREDGRCLCGAPVDYDPQSEPRPSELQCLQAVRDLEQDLRAGGPESLEPEGHVIARLARLGFGEVASTGQLERLYDARLIECGLSLRVPWLTGEGRARLQELLDRS